MYNIKKTTITLSQSRYEIYMVKYIQNIVKKYWRTWSCNYVGMTACLLLVKFLVKGRHVMEQGMKQRHFYLFMSQWSKVLHQHMSFSLCCSPCLIFCFLFLWFKYPRRKICWGISARPADPHVVVLALCSTRACSCSVWAGASTAVPSPVWTLRWRGRNHHRGRS